jgi:V8-like Glu-specific endopeptidase
VSRLFWLLALVAVLIATAFASVPEANAVTSSPGSSVSAAKPRKVGRSARRPRPGCRHQVRTPSRDCRRPAHARSSIVGGRLASEPWPSIAAVVKNANRYPGNDNDRQFCGGTLIKPRLVLTAAHCVTNNDAIQDTFAQDMQVVLGRRVLSGSGGERIDVAGVAIHPSYKRWDLGYDVAVLRLSRPAAEAPATLAGEAEWGTQATAQGWGDTYSGSGAGSDELRVADLPLWKDGDCLATYSGYDAATMLCAGDPTVTSTCQGDSGGPLMLFTAAGWKLIGVTSWGYRCDQRESFFAWASGPKLRSWILGQPEVVDTAPAPAPPPATVPAPPSDGTAPVISTLALSPKRFQAAKRGASIARAVGTSVSYRISEAAQVSIKISRCRKTRGRRLCKALAGALSRTANVGYNRFGFSGRLGGRLAPGRYRLTLRARDAAGNRSPSKSVSFAVVR